MVHAINSRPLGTGDVAAEMLLPNEDQIAGLERSMLEAARRYGASESARVLIRPGPVGAIILDAAREVDIELIAMGRHGRSGVKRLLLGCVAEHVLRHADCPVVTVHARGDGDSGSTSASSKP